MGDTSPVLLGHYVAENLVQVPDVELERALPGYAPEFIQLLRDSKTITVMGVDRWLAILKLVGVEPDQVQVPSTVRLFIRPPKFTDRLRELRKGAVLSQGEVAKKLEIPVNTYVQYEGGRRIPPFPVVVKLARLFGVPVDHFANCEFREDTPTLFDKLHDDDGPSGDPIPF